MNRREGSLSLLLLFLFWFVDLCTAVLPYETQRKKDCLGKKKSLDVTGKVGWEGISILI